MNQQAFARRWWLLPVGRLHPLWWVGIAGLLLWVDYVTGPKTQFPVVYAIPVTLAAWYSGRWPALAFGGRHAAGSRRLLGGAGETTGVDGHTRGDDDDSRGSGHCNGALVRAAFRARTRTPPPCADIGRTAADLFLL